MIDRGLGVPFWTTSTTDSKEESSFESDSSRSSQAERTAWQSYQYCSWILRDTFDQKYMLNSLPFEPIEACFDPIFFLLSVIFVPEEF